LVLFYMSPKRAASAVLDHGRPLFAAIAALLVTLAISFGADRVRSYEVSGLLQREHAAFLASPRTMADYAAFQEAQFAASRTVRARYSLTGVSALAAMAAVFVPFCLLVLAAWDGLGRGSAVLSRDYIPALTGLLFAWTAAHLPMALVWWVIRPPDPGLAVPLQIAGLAVFVILAAPVLETVTGAGLSHTAITAIPAITLMSGAALLFAGASQFLYLLASPWLLFIGYQLLGRGLPDIGGAFSARQAFKRQLELSTVNPHDADAHYQLGLLYSQRRLTAEAEASFRRALAIDAADPDVLFQLGSLLRRQPGGTAEAIGLLERAAELSPRLSNHEVWRELGAAVLDEGRTDESLRYLAHYTAAREYDPEGLVHYGRALRAAGRTPEAQDAFRRAISSAETAPRFRRSEVARWERAARAEMKQLG
jgi:Flp pilus assembly protein TadD